MIESRTLVEPGRITIREPALVGPWEGMTEIDGNGCHVTFRKWRRDIRALTPDEPPLWDKVGEITMTIEEWYRFVWLVRKYAVVSARENECPQQIRITPEERA